MEQIKEWCSCVVSFIGGVLGLALSALSGMVVDVFADASNINPALNVTESRVTDAYKVITDGELHDQAILYGAESEFLCMKAFAVLAFIVSILLVIFAVIKLLQNLSVLKGGEKVISIIGHVLMCAFLAVMLGLLISSITYANAVEAPITAGILAQFGAYAAYVSVSVTASVGAYQIAMTVIAGVVVALYAVSVILNGKKKN